MRAHTQDVHFDVCAIQLSTESFRLLYAYVEWTLNLVAIAVIIMSSPRRHSNFNRIVNKTQMGTVRWFFHEKLFGLVAKKTMDRWTMQRREGEEIAQHKYCRSRIQWIDHRNKCALSAQKLCHCIWELRTKHVFYDHRFNQRCECLTNLIARKKKNKSFHSSSARKKYFFEDSSTFLELIFGRISTKFPNTDFLIRISKLLRKHIYNSAELKHMQQRHHPLVADTKPTSNPIIIFLKNIDGKITKKKWKKPTIETQHVMPFHQTKIQQKSFQFEWRLWQFEFSISEKTRRCILGRTVLAFVVLQSF